MTAATEGCLVYKITSRDAWKRACGLGVFPGAPVDLADGFIHFSTATQLAETAQKHFRGQHELVVVAFRSDSLGAGLKWEPSRGGDLFPHLYGPLDPADAVWVADMPLDETGTPIVPERVGKC